MEYRNLSINGAVLDKQQLEKYLEKLASDQILQNNSNKDTYPIPQVKENFEIIKQVYELLNEHIKLGIPIHPAGEWLLDNFYIIEETVKTICKDLPLKKYTKFLGISNGVRKGFARIYVLATEIVAYTDNKIDSKQVKDYIQAYQRKKTLSMEEIWNIGLFMQIAIIQNIKQICEKIYFSQMQKYRVENILERLVENKEELKYKNLGEYKAKVKGYGEMKYPFIEYMSYRLKKYGKTAYSFTQILEEQVNKMGSSIEEIVKKEHFDIALKKVSMANCITSMKELLRVDFLDIFEKINGVEDILKQDPANVYINMDYKTKEAYRSVIKEISAKAKISEIYIAQKVLELAKNKEQIQGKTKEAHVGYYLIDKGKIQLYKTLHIPIPKLQKEGTKLGWYIFSIWGISAILDLAFTIYFYKELPNIWFSILLFLSLWIPLQEIMVQIIQYISNKMIKPKLIPKLDMQNGISKENATVVVIPTIIKSKEKVVELMKKLEVYSLANQSENLYFALLGDCSSGANKEELFDQEVENAGIEEAKRLNEKYPQAGFPKFHFIYRKRFWNGKEECYLGWERKRGLLNQFNEYLLGHIDNVFRSNTLEDWKKKENVQEEKKFPEIRYVITLDADTNLTLNTGLELVGAMAHILNKPILNAKKDAVVEGHALMQPRVGIDLEVSLKNIFTKIYAGSGGTDNYTNAISDFYQDNFGEGIFTGKGIYDLSVFSQVLKDEIPENTVLSHDLLEGSYLRCGLVSDIMLMDGYPYSYQSFKSRLHRWIRGDVQIVRWLQKRMIDRKENKKKNPLNILSKYKIGDNLIRAICPIITLFSFLYIIILDVIENINIWPFITILTVSVLAPTLLDILNRIIYRKEGESSKKRFSPVISSLGASILRGILALGVLPDKAYFSADAIGKTIYRLTISKKHLLEWTTSEEAEKLAKTDLKSYYFSMIANVVLGVLGILYICLAPQEVISIGIFILSVLWLITPAIMWYISKTAKVKKKVEELNKQEQAYLLEIGEKTWQYFKEYLTKETNYLPPDNYQEDRKPKVVYRTSPTNIGLALLAVISSYDLGYETLKDTLILLSHMVNTIESLPKWHGHLYNWYQIETMQPLIPRYVSTVDSGNFVGYVYVLKAFYEQIAKALEEKQAQEAKELLSYIPHWALGPIQEIPFAKADFSKLYDEEKHLFSIGFNIEENQLTDSYYDLLASEARQSSMVAIAKKDISPKHWRHLSRTLTSLNQYKGLLSWSGTAFEYLMPNVNMKKYTGSLLDESCQFMLMSQQEYAKKLGVPWGFSETAFNVKDFGNNYQYKAIGIPWLGLKRGLEDDIVVSTYGSVLAITEEPKAVLKNLKKLEEQDMYHQYGFYESIDYTPTRLRKGETYATVKTYMAHHQALILLSINNLFHENILPQRFHQNPEVEAVEILLQERMPESMIVTKEQKEKPMKIKYKDYEDYTQRVYTKIHEKLNPINAISNENYLIVMDQKGQGYSQYKDIQINRYQEEQEEVQGIFFYLKNIRNKRIWTAGYRNDLAKPDKYEITFAEDMHKIARIDGNIETTMKVTIASDKPVEIRQIEIKNTGMEEETIEITSVLEPILSTRRQDEAHPAFNSLFLTSEYLEEENILLLKRKERNHQEIENYIAVTLTAKENTVGELEYEIDKEKFYGRGNLGIPQMVEYSKPFSKKNNLTPEPILAMRRTISIKPEEKAELGFILAIGNSKEEVIEAVKNYTNLQARNQTFALARARVETEARYLGLQGKKIELYQKMLGYLLYLNPLKKETVKQILQQNKNLSYTQEALWKFGISGDIPILLVKIQDISDIEVLEEILKAYVFYQMKNIKVDVVILNEEPNSYESYVKEAIQNAILNEKLDYLLNQHAGIYILENIEEIDKAILEVRANLTIDAQKGTVDRILKEAEEEYIDQIKTTADQVHKEILPLVQEKNRNTLSVESLKYYNEYGGFTLDGKEYWIRQNKEHRLPTVWSHVLTNQKFGSIITDSMGGYTWYKNSHLNRLTKWNNYQVTDIPSEIIYMQEEESGNTCSLGLNPMPDENDYDTIYGFGYSKYRHTSSQIEQELTIFVPENQNCKIQLLELKNLAPKKRKLKFVYYCKPILGETQRNSNGYLSMQFQENENMLLVKNIAGETFQEYMYVSSSEKINSYTGNKNFFIGNGNLKNPEALRKTGLNNEDSLGNNSIMAIQIEVELEAFESKNISFIMGIEEEILAAQDNAYQFHSISNCLQAYESTKKYWETLTQKVQVETPLESFNLLLNGWLVYQTITSRLWAKSGFYQSGGAYGFRDQLQDTIGLKYINPEFMKAQILKHSKHQFIEGDVEHWWHEEIQMGIRTKFSDDLLWLVYLTEEYISFTGDEQILEEKTPYLEGKILEENQDEKYDHYINTELEETLYEHCIRAIEKSLSFGENGLPKIGTGDWNDGFSNVGREGKGESVWLGFFQYLVLKRWLDIQQRKIEQLEGEKKETEIQRKQKYETIIENLKKALNTNAWDGRWYKRAFADNGDILGTIQNEECKIDSISQSWSVISGAGDNDKKFICMESLENHLVDRENGIIKLLDPPFEKSKLEPGYIKAYLPGTRENGGQYTHSAIWAIIAMAELGFGDKVVELYRMINPIEHARTKEAAQKYKVEPYVIAADIYGYGNLAGRGGWTWYTGSSSWMLDAGIEYILGLRIYKGILSIQPCIAHDWKAYKIHYRYGNSLYHIKVENPNEKTTGIHSFKVNGQEIEEKQIRLQNDGKVYEIEVSM
ncbi:MAG: GH36-type glycosyl hydrolase domain-containing protein [Clostridia bacterium]